MTDYNDFILTSSFNLFSLFNSCSFSQVSHHPPAAAHHAISEKGWTLRQEITLASKFRGKYLSIMPLGGWICLCSSVSPRCVLFLQSLSFISQSLNMLIYGKCILVKQDKTEVFNMDCSLSPGSIQCLFDKSNNHYSWKKVTTTVHNIIVGKLWIDQVTLQAAWILHISDQQQINQDIPTDEELFKLMFSPSSLGRSMW